MKKLSDYTTTELLLIAYRIELPDHENVYSQLCAEARRHNYSSCIEFAEDMRFKKLVQVYKEKKQQQLQMIEQNQRINITNDLPITDNPIVGQIDSKNTTLSHSKDITNQEDCISSHPQIMSNQQDIFTSDAFMKRTYGTDKSQFTAKMDSTQDVQNLLTPVHNNIQNINTTFIKDPVSTNKSIHSTKYNQFIDNNQSHMNTNNDSKDITSTSMATHIQRSDSIPFPQGMPSCNKNTLFTTDLFTLKRIPQSRPVKKPSTQFSFKIKPDTRFSKTHIIPHNQNKQSKVFYRQMTDDEKEIDDFLDKLHEKNNEKIRSKNMETGEKNESNTFTSISEKVTSRKGIRDKTLWPSELKIILDEIQSFYNLDYDLKENISLIQAILPILMKLQQFILEKDQLDKAFYFKKVIMAFYDFYKK